MTSVFNILVRVYVSISVDTSLVRMYRFGLVVWIIRYALGSVNDRHKGHDTKDTLPVLQDES